MDKFIKNFMRKADGVWECRRPTELKLPEGRIQVAPGTVLTKTLEAEYRRARLRPRL